jgi:predicted ATPase/DNA-binding SARP family transcriptional activator
MDSASREIPILQLQLFGAPEIRLDDVAYPGLAAKTQALLFYLAMTRRPHLRTALAALLWADMPEKDARGNLRKAIQQLQDKFGDYLTVDHHSLGLRADAPCWVDAVEFLSVAGGGGPSGPEPGGAAANCLRAVELYGGEFLEGFYVRNAPEFEAWMLAEKDRLREALLRCLESLAGHAVAQNDIQQALAFTRRIVEIEPWREDAQRRLIELLAESGQRAAALKQYESCRQALLEELGVEPELETTALFEVVRAGAAVSPSLVPAHNLPPDPTPFVGREAELAQVAGHLADPACRLLTLLGPGGIGKTRLAIQAARAHVEGFTDGVWFVDLAPITSMDLLASTILHVLPVHASGADAKLQLVEYLRDKQLLLVLDNFEHLLAATGLLMDLLRSAPRLKQLVTSRVRLNLHQEWLLPLAGLDLPAAQDGADIGEEQDDIAEANEPPRLTAPALDRYGATALFVERARRLRPNFRASGKEAADILRICRLLDGMPLAIELAAAHTRSLSLEKIAQELQHGLQLLSTSVRDVPERQSSMTAAFDHSWRLLSDHQRSILRQASVFQGGWTADATEGVTGASKADLEELIDASWLRLVAGGRYEMHELTRQYCAEKLVAEHHGVTGEGADGVHDRHAAWYRSLLLARQGELYRRPGLVAEMAAEYNNLLAAWHWFVATDNLDAVRTMIAGLYWIAYRQGWDRTFMRQLETYALQLKEGGAATRPVPDRSSEHALVLATILATLLAGALPVARKSWHTWGNEAMSLLAQAETDDERWREVRWSLRYAMATRHFHEGHYFETAASLRTLLQELAEGRFKPWPYTDEARYHWQSEGYFWLDLCALFLGQYEEALRLAEQNLALAEQTGAPFLKTVGLERLATALLYTDDCQQAEQRARELLTVCRAHGNRRGGARASWTLGQALAGQGSYVRARAFLRRTLAFARETGELLIEALHHLGNVELALGNLVEAKRLYREMLQLCEGWELSYGLVVALTGLARVALAGGDLAEARARLLRALKIRWRSFPIDHTISALAAMAEIEQAEGQLESATELCAALLSWPTTPPYTPNTVQHLREELAASLQKLEAQLSPEIYAAAIARGRARSVDDVVAELAEES